MSTLYSMKILGNRWVQIFLFLVFMAIWIAPIWYVWWTRKPIPVLWNHLNDLYRIACLFTHRSTYRWDLDIQVQLEGDNERRNTRYEDFSNMLVFGYLDRLRRIYDNLPEQDPKYKWAIAEFIKSRFEYLYPEMPIVTGVRFVVIAYPTTEDNPRAYPTWHWRKPDLDILPDQYQSVDYTHSFTDNYRDL